MNLASEALGQLGQVGFELPEKAVADPVSIETLEQKPHPGGMDWLRWGPWP